MEEMVRCGVPKDVFLPPEVNSRFMNENLSLTAKLLKENEAKGTIDKIKSVVVVQTPLYNRQAKAAFNKNFTAEENSTASQDGVTGYVYAPYVPLQVTPTIFGIEDFVPRKGVMTRYAKKMVRPDMYGLVVVQDLLG